MAVNGVSGNLHRCFIHSVLVRLVYVADGASSTFGFRCLVSHVHVPCAQLDGKHRTNKRAFIVRFLFRLLTAIVNLCFFY